MALLVQIVVNEDDLRKSKSYIELTQASGKYREVQLLVRLSSIGRLPRKITKKMSTKKTVFSKKQKVYIYIF